MDNISRRKFIQYSGMAAASTPFVASQPFYTFSGETKVKHPICIFSKHLQWLNYEDAGKFARDMGFDGVDLTVRKGGHVPPESVEKLLPEAVEKITKAGITVPMMATDIKDVEDPLTERVLKVAGKNGIKMYRMSYQNYDPSLEIVEYLNSLAPKLRKIGELSQQHGLKAMYQNHDGERVGAAVWDIAYAIKKANHPALGMQYDPRHATVEGGFSWIYDMKLVKKMITSIVAKDFYWEKGEDGKWDVKNVPLGEGMVDFKKFFSLYKEYNIEGPITVHVEYPMFSGDEKSMSMKQKIKEATEVLTFEINALKKFMTEAGIRTW
ncbi:MAG: sugar phosphate isomerase/epimerase [Cyclobacteriaceae bacterium]|nr:sugar phosphate isomerase/epimerase [Cyclobacteriaceae bacterium]